MNTSHITDLEGARREIEHLRQEIRKATADVAVSRDATRDKMRELAREFRVPLTTVLGFSDILSAVDKSHSFEWNQIAIAGHQLMELVQGLEQHGPNESSLKQPLPEPLEPATRTILHVEDNETNFRLVERILEDRPNIAVTWCSNGNEAAASAAEKHPALILLDLNLPDIHGSEVLAQLRTNPVTEKIPVIVLSGDSSPSRIERMLQAGARDYLIKPFDITHLLFVVDEALAGPAKLAA